MKAVVQVGEADRNVLPIVGAGQPTGIVNVRSPSGKLFVAVNVHAKLFVCPAVTVCVVGVTLKLDAITDAGSAETAAGALAKRSKNVSNTGAAPTPRAAAMAASDTSATAVTTRIKSPMLRGFDRVGESLLFTDLLDMFISCF